MATFRQCWATWLPKNLATLVSTICLASMKIFFHEMINWRCRHVKKCVLCYSCCLAPALAGSYGSGLSITPDAKWILIDCLTDWLQTLGMWPQVARCTQSNLSAFPNGTNSHEQHLVVTQPEMWIIEGGGVCFPFPLSSSVPFFLLPSPFFPFSSPSPAPFPSLRSKTPKFQRRRSGKALWAPSTRSEMEPQPKSNLIQLQP